MNIRDHKAVAQTILNSEGDQFGWHRHDRDTVWFKTNKLDPAIKDCGIYYREEAPDKFGLSPEGYCLLGYRTFHLENAYIFSRKDTRVHSAKIIDIAERHDAFTFTYFKPSDAAFFTDEHRLVVVFPNESMVEKSDDPMVMTVRMPMTQSYVEYLFGGFKPVKQSLFEVCER